MVCHGTVMILVESQIFTVEVQLPHGGAGGLAAAEFLRQNGVREGDLGVEIQGPPVFVPVGGVEGDRVRPPLRQKGEDVGLIQLPVPLEEDLDIVVPGGGQLPYPVAVQVRLNYGVAVGPGQQIRRSAAVHGVVVVEGGVVFAVLLGVVGDGYAAVAKQVMEGADVLGGVLRTDPLRKGEKQSRVWFSTAARMAPSTDW